jgi:hypothetical protein
LTAHREASGVRKKGAELSEAVSQASHFTSLLKSCKSMAERAHSGLETLMRHSGATAGVLYLLDEQGLSCAARAGNFVPDPKLEQLMHAYFDKEAHDRDETQSNLEPARAARTACEWAGPAGERYMPVLLSHAGELGWALTGLAVLVIERGASFTYPTRFASTLSRTLASSGDARIVHAQH